MSAARPAARPAPRARKPEYAGDPAVAGGFHGHLVGFVEWLRAMRFSEHTIKARRVDLGYFIDWCEERAVVTPAEVTRAMLERYRQYVFAYRRQRDGLPLSANCQGARLVAVRVFFRWLARQHHLLFNPASEMDMPRQEKRLPRHVLGVAEVAQIIDAAPVDDPSGLGLRDRAILETLYSTGMRRAELTALELGDVDARRGTLLIRLGKGGKDRVVPIGERALAWVGRYVDEVRGLHLDDENDATLFLTRQGVRLTPKQLSAIVKKAIDAAGLERVRVGGPLGSSCHLFRHACATHMLENGADVRFIQALLGHADLGTTEIYTQVAILKLKQVHEATHPARMPGRGAADGEDQGQAGDARAALMALLDADAAQDTPN